MIRIVDTKDINPNLIMDFYNKHATWMVSTSLKDWKEIIENSSCIISAWDSENLIGAARSLSDGVRWATIIDVLVHPKYQRKGIGCKIIKKMIEQDSMQVRTIYLATENMDEFYMKNGFIDVSNKCSYMIRLNKDNEEKYVLPVV